MTFVENWNSVWACFRCGKVAGDVRKDSEEGPWICEECGESGIVTIPQALDIINDFYLREEFTLDYDEEYYEDMELPDEL